MIQSALYLRLMALRDGRGEFAIGVGVKAAGVQSAISYALTMGLIERVDRKAVPRLGGAVCDIFRVLPAGQKMLDAMPKEAPAPRRATIVPLGRGTFVPERFEMRTWSEAGQSGWDDDSFSRLFGLTMRQRRS